MLSRRICLYGGAVVGGAFWGVAWLLTYQAADRQGAEQGLWRERPTWSDDQHLVVLFGHLWLAVAVAWLIVVAIGTAGLIWGRRAVLRSIGIALIVGPSAGWLIVAWMALQRLLFGWRFNGGI
jgi:hypothetical protein